MNKEIEILARAELKKIKLSDIKSSFEIGEALLKMYEAGFAEFQKQRPSQEQFNLIEDLRLYLRMGNKDYAIDCLHYLGDEAQSWHYNKEKKKEKTNALIEDYKKRFITLKDDFENWKPVLTDAEAMRITKHLEFLSLAISNLRDLL